MGFVKSLTAASLLSLSSVVALGGVAAQAADLAPLPAPPLPPPVEFAGNWYIRGDVGVASYSTGQWTQPVTVNQGEQLLSSGFLSKSIQEPAFIDAGIGYQFNQWIRADVTAEYRTAIGLRGVFQEKIFNPFVPFAFLGQNEMPGTLQSTLVMANAYADIGTWYGLTPYVGAGVGIVRHNMSGFTDSGFAFSGTAFAANGLPNGALSPVLNSPITDKTKTNFAWAAMAGLSYSITPNLKLDLGYRYMNLGTVSSGIIHCLCGQTFQGFKVKDLTSNEFRIGMRWMFGEVGPIAMAPPAPEYVPQQPIVRKY
ncbi:Opacity protein [Rhizobiales bacterium GAS191]|jgi:opacity protein-like surface antigen|nr:Opacity protein [Rhizobiales bacterium GAS113]SED47863.1 Opacity protein [Rhizobiales bacterium GAS188]SEE92264.1 Opacity protein [Rhizobiales bacterium GAS191]